MENTLETNSLNLILFQFMVSPGGPMLRVSYLGLFSSEMGLVVLVKVGPCRRQ